MAGVNILAMRKLVSVFLLLISSSTCLAADIPLANRIKNRPPGYCGWCCLETLGRTLDIPKMFNLAANREADPDFVYYIHNGPFLQPVVEKKNWASRLAVQSKLTELGVKHRITLFDRTHLSGGAEKTGCVVFIRPGGFGPEGHAVIATKYNEKNIRLIDPNTTKELDYSREVFDKWWDGTTITLEK